VPQRRLESLRTYCFVNILGPQKVWQKKICKFDGLHQQVESAIFNEFNAELFRRVKE